MEDLEQKKNNKRNIYVFVILVVLILGIFAVRLFISNTESNQLGKMAVDCFKEGGNAIVYQDQNIYCTELNNFSIGG